MVAIVVHDRAVAQTDVGFRAVYRSKRLESAKKVGAHKPTKIPNRSPWARSGSLDRNQIAMAARTEKNPATKQMLLRTRHVEADIIVSLKDSTATEAV